MDTALDPQYGTIIFDNIPHGIFTVDALGMITSFNQAAEKITGWQRQEVIGMACAKVFQSDHCENSCFLRNSIERGRQHRDEEVLIRRRDGTQLLVSVSTADLVGKDGQVVGGVEMFRDLSMVATLRRQINEIYTSDDIVSKSAAMRGVRELLPLLAKSTSTVLVEGEPGTGKELVARAIHNLGPRRDKPFVAVNCGALPETLAESELFGHMKGAFTDAQKDKPGRFALADGGSLFLDEVGEITQTMQVKLLRVLQERQFTPLGAVAPVPMDVRILAATNRDLTSEVSHGRFRQDLFFRLNVVRVNLPPLRARNDDIPLLVEHFINKFNALQGRRIQGISERAMAILMRYQYPGNVRELENAIEHGFVICGSSTIEVEDLPPYIRGEKLPPIVEVDVAASAVGAPFTPDSTIFPILPTSLTSPAAPSFGVPLPPTEPASGLLQDAEATTIREALTRQDGNRTKAAAELGISRNTLWRKMKRYGIK
jgi:PAS domain S-box-containing protein